MQRSHHLVSEREWLDELESLYFSDMITELKFLLPRAFESSKNCFDFVLYVVKFADFDIQAGKKSLAYLTVVEFEAWLKSKLKEEVFKKHRSWAFGLLITTRTLLLEAGCVFNIFTF